ncbi:LuxR family transcriptional regulator [Streptomyces hainanensis]|nr:LuxR family transcriptional regulator [Streptomyces hainanensis]
MMADLPEDDRIAELVADYHSLSGGNPLMLRALLEDAKDVWVREPACGEQLAVGPAYLEAVVAGLYRSGPRALLLARGMAIFGAWATPELLAELLDIPSGTLPGLLQALEEAGLLVGCELRHHCVASMLFADMAPEERAALHRRAAELLHAAAAPTAVVAEHLLASPDEKSPWEVAVLQEAATELLREDRPEEAIRYLERTLAVCSDEQQRIGIRIRLAAVARRLGLQVAHRHLELPLAAMRAGQLSAGHLASLGRLLGVFGQIGEMREAMSRLHALAANREREGEAEAQIEMLLAADGQLSSGIAASPTVEGMRRAVVPWTAMAGPRVPSADVVAAAEEVLRLTRLSDTTLDTLINAVKTVALSDRPSRAVYWARMLGREAEGRRAFGWLSLFASIEAAAALRLGRLAEAEAAALRCLDRLRGPDADLFAAAPISLLVRVYTLMGSYEDAARSLSWQAPKELGGNLLGAFYRRAQGHYYLATGRHHAAVGEFLAVGRQLTRWGLDGELALPWRGDLAEALTALGDRKQAERYAAQQIDMMPDSGSLAHQLRLQALGRTPRRRAMLLTQAAELLAVSEDVVDYGQTLVDLGLAQRALGEDEQAEATLERAWQLAAEHDMGHLRRLIEDRTVASDEPGRQARLSDSERRVAVLALEGQTNREIAAALFVTVSTVEQHLTRVYRKFGLQGRHDLVRVPELARVAAAGGA